MPGKEHPRISIGMAVYNGEEFLEQAICSNLEQTMPEFELVISDNASTDRTEEICRAFSRSDRRVRYFRNDENIGAARNFNRAFELSRGEYFRWSNADDLAEPELLEHTFALLESRPDVVIAYGRTQLIDFDGKAIEVYEDNLDLQQQSVVQRYRDFFRRVGLTNVIYGLMRSSAVKKTRLMGNGRLPAGDINFMASMILQGKFVEIPKVLFHRRVHEKAFSANPDPEAEASFWSGTASVSKLPHWRHELANIGAVLRSPACLQDKLSLLVYSARRLSWHRDKLLRDVSSALRQTAG